MSEINLISQITMDQLNSVKTAADWKRDPLLRNTPLTLSVKAWHKTDPGKTVIYETPDKFTLDLATFSKFAVKSTCKFQQFGVYNTVVEFMDVKQMIKLKTEEAKQAALASNQPLPENYVEMPKYFSVELGEFYKCADKGYLESPKTLHSDVIKNALNAKNIDFSGEKHTFLALKGRGRKDIDAKNPENYRPVPQTIVSLTF